MSTVKDLIDTIYLMSQQAKLNFIQNCYWLILD